MGSIPKLHPYALPLKYSKKTKVDTILEVGRIDAFLLAIRDKRTLLKPQISFLCQVLLMEKNVHS